MTDLEKAFVDFVIAIVVILIFFEGCWLVIRSQVISADIITKPADLPIGIALMILPMLFLLWKGLKK